MIFLRSSQRLFRSLLPALVAVCLLSSSLKAFDEFAYDLRVIRALAEANMADYALIQVDRMIKMYPEKKDLIMLQKALVYYSQNKRTRAEEIVNSIGKDSPLFGEASLIKAGEAFKRGQYDVAKGAFADYFSTDPKPRSEAKPDVEAFLETVFMYAQASVEQGDPLGAVKAVGNAEKIKGELALSEGMVAYQKGKLALDACDKALDQGRKPSPELVKTISAKLEELQFKQIDYLLMINALVEVAHGHIILGDIDADAATGGNKKAKLASAKGHYNKAMQTLKSLNELLAAVKDKVPPKDSPLAGAYYYFGRIRKGLARVAMGSNNNELAVKQLNSGKKFFSRVRGEFNASPYSTPALIEEGKMNALLEKLGQAVDDSDGGAIGGAIPKIKEADQFFGAKNFEKAAPLYLEALKLVRTHARMAPETGLKLVVCYANLDKMLEAQAIASFLADVFPDAEETAKSLLQLGATPFEAAQKMPEGPKKEALMEEAMTAWDQYVEVAPEDTNAPDIAFVIAENEYRKAAMVAKEASNAKDKAKKEELKSQARELYRGAIPKYERMTTMFGGNPKGVRAYYKLAWIYDSLDMPQKAAEAFLTYAQRETLPENREDRLEALFRAGEQLLFSETPAAALDPLQRLLDWVKPGNPQGFDADAAKARKVKEDATSYLGWAYDLAAEKVRPRITEIKDSQDARQAEIKEANAQLKRIAAEEQEVEQWLAELTRELEELTVDFRNPLPTPEDDLLKSFMEEANADQWSEQERAIELPKLKERVAAEAAKAIQRRVQGIQALKAEFEERKENAFKRFQLSQKELADTTTEIANKTDQLTDLEEERQYRAGLLDEKLEEYKQATQAVAAAQATVEDLQARYSTALETFKTGTPEEKAAAREEGREARSLMPGARNRLARAQRKMEELDSRESVIERRRAQREKDAAARKVALMKEQLTRLKRQKALLTLDSELFQQLNKAYAQSLPLADKLMDILNLPPDERYKEAVVADWKADTRRVLDLFAAAEKTVVVKADTAKQFLGQDREALKNQIAAAQAKIADLEEKIKPVQAEFDELKKQALAAFNRFLEAYPKSRHVPDNMARLGTTYMEFDQYEEAEKYLNELAAKYPDHKAVKQAMFSLGKVQAEIDKPDAAAKAFEKVLENPQAQPAGNLKYIVRATMDSQHANLALKASRELLARSENVNHEDYDKLSGRQREALLFRAAKSAMSTEDYQAAAGYLSQLLSENPKTARFFEANILLGRAYRLMKPAQKLPAKRALNEVITFSQDRAVTTEAVIELAKVNLGSETPGEALMALGTLGKLVIVLDGEVEVIADDSDPAIRPMVDEAFYLAAKCSALSGNTADKELLVAEYRERFPDGRYRQEIGNLPGN